MGVGSGWWGLTGAARLGRGGFPGAELGAAGVGAVGEGRSPRPAGGWAGEGWEKLGLAGKFY